MTVVDDLRASSRVHRRNAGRQFRYPAVVSIGQPTPADPSIAIAPADYRSAMRNIAAAVTVVTTATDRGRQGLTVTAVTSVSADPPQLLVCINRNTRSAEAISATGQFGVNYLDAGHAELAAVFAAPTDDHEERFRLARWVDSPTGTPLLQDALVAFDCSVVNEIHSGTHTIFIGQVANIRARDGRPLLYQHGAFTTTGPHPGPA